MIIAKTHLSVMVAFAICLISVGCTSESDALAKLSDCGATVLDEDGIRSVFIAEGGWHGVVWSGSTNDLNALTQLKAVNRLDLEFYSLKGLPSASCLDFLPKLHRLEELHISASSRIEDGDSVIKRISNCKDLKKLSIVCLPFVSANVEFDKLEELAIDAQYVEDIRQLDLKLFKSLREVRLYGRPLVLAELELLLSNLPQNQKITLRFLAKLEERAAMVELSERRDIIALIKVSTPTDNFLD